MTQKRQLTFSKHYRKLNWANFHTVRWPDAEYTLGRVYDIVFVSSNYFHSRFVKGKARIVKMELARLGDVATEQFCLEDADCTVSEFYNLMDEFYCQKPDWKGWDSEVQVLYCQRVNAK